jgi:hypothetical protein
MTIKEPIKEKSNDNINYKLCYKKAIEENFLLKKSIKFFQEMINTALNPSVRKSIDEPLSNYLIQVAKC